jgi:hypothetical protein
VLDISAQSFSVRQVLAFATSLQIKAHEIQFVAEIIGRRRNARVASITSALTQQRLGWKPTSLGLIADISRPGYFG